LILAKDCFGRRPSFTAKTIRHERVHEEFTMTLAISLGASPAAPEPAQQPTSHELRWASVGTVYLSAGDPNEGDDESDDFDENDFDDDFDDDFEEEVEDDEFESADPFQFDE
jgi:hypothetical protein